MDNLWMQYSEGAITLYELVIVLVREALLAGRFNTVEEMINLGRLYQSAKDGYNNLPVPEVFQDLPPLPKE